MIQLGIDIGGTCVKAAIRENGRYRRTGQSPFYSRPNAEELRRAILAATGPLQDVDSVGLCVPGIMNEARNEVLVSVNVPGLVNLSLDRVVPDALGIDDDRPTVICNDAAAAAYDLYETYRPAGRLLVLTLGTGVGNAVVDDGVLLDMGEGCSGHLGQVDVTLPGHEDIVGPDGGAGGLEGYIGIAALRRQYGSDASKAIANFTGDEPAVASLVRVLRISHAIYRPKHIWLCGGIGIRLRHLLPLIQDRVCDRLTNVAQTNWTLNVGNDDFHAARGAAFRSAEASLDEVARIAG